MPWNQSRYPVSMRNLPDSVRQKAIAIANALLEEGYGEGRAIRIAIAQAKRWREGGVARTARPRPGRSGQSRACRST